jgi:hypothetical protein
LTFQDLSIANGHTDDKAALALLYCESGASSSRIPSSTKFMAAMPLNSFDTEQILKSVSLVTGLLVLKLSTPN